MPQNSISIFQSSANYDQKQQGDNILDFLIEIYFRVLQMNTTQVKINYFFFFLNFLQLLNKISELISNLLNFNNAAPRNFTKIYRRNSVQFYSGNVSTAILSHSVKLLQVFFFFFFFFWLLLKKLKIGHFFKIYSFDSRTAKLFLLFLQ